MCTVYCLWRPMCGNVCVYVCFCVVYISLQKTGYFWMFVPLNVEVWVPWTKNAFLHKSMCVSKAHVCMWVSLHWYLSANRLYEFPFVCVFSFKSCNHSVLQPASCQNKPKKKKKIKDVCTSFSTCLWVCDRGFPVRLLSEGILSTDRLTHTYALRSETPHLQQLKMLIVSTRMWSRNS